MAFLERMSLVRERHCCKVTGTEESLLSRILKEVRNFRRLKVDGMDGIWFVETSREVRESTGKCSTIMPPIRFS